MFFVAVKTILFIIVFLSSCFVQRGIEGGRRLFFSDPPPDDEAEKEE